MILKNIAHIQSGYITRKKVESKRGSRVSLLQARDVDGDRLTRNRANLLPFEPGNLREEWLLRKGDILFMSRGAKNFSIYMEEPTLSIVAAACFFVIRPTSPKINPQYLWWYLNQSPSQNHFHRFGGSGVAMPVVPRTVLESLPVPLPNLERQKKIVQLWTLAREEEELALLKVKKQKELITTVCLEATENHVGCKADIKPKIHNDSKRTTPKGFVSYAREFFETALAADEKLGIRPGFEIIAPIPIMYLVGHSIELSLKAYLIQEGINLEKLPGKKYGHNLENCLNEANALGLSQLVTFNDHEKGALKALNNLFNSKQLNYSVTGLKDFPVFGPIEEVCRKLLEGIECHLSKRENEN